MIRELVDCGRSYTLTTSLFLYHYYVGLSEGKVVGLDVQGTRGKKQWICETCGLNWIGSLHDCLISLLHDRSFSETTLAICWIWKGSVHVPYINFTGGRNNHRLFRKTQLRSAKPDETGTIAHSIHVTKFIIDSIESASIGCAFHP